MGVRKSVAATVSPISAPATPLTPLKSRHSLNIPQAADYLSVSRWWIEELIRNGKIAFRVLNNGSNDSVRLLDAGDLDEFLLSTPKQRITEIVKGKALTERTA